MKVATRSALILLLSFMIGSVFGAFLSLKISREFKTHAAPKRLPPRMDKGENRLATMIFHVIDASEEQEETLRPIIKRYDEKMKRMHDQIRSETKANFDSLFNELKAHLNDSQIERLREQTRRRERMQRRPARRGRPKGRPPHGDFPPFGN